VLLVRNGGNDHGTWPLHRGGELPCIDASEDEDGELPIDLIQRRVIRAGFVMVWAERWAAPGLWCWAAHWAPPGCFDLPGRLGKPFFSFFSFSFSVFLFYF
jgi:hypothetical protein